jgi:hypothetical protein
MSMFALNSPSIRSALAAVVCREVAYLEPKRVFLIILYNGIFLIIKILIYPI